MWKITVLLFILPLVTDCTPEERSNNNVQMTRTSIKVARNLDPDAMETLEVKTRTGDVATIVVKKRDGRQQFAGPASNLQLTAVSRERAPTAARVPEPVVIRSDSVYVKNQKEAADGAADNKRSRSLLQVDSDGIPVITGVREPDDANDTQVWRNARVINGVLVPNDFHAPPAVREQYKPAAAAVAHPMFNGIWHVYKKKPENAGARVPNDEDELQLQQQHSAGPQPDAYNEKYMTDKILGYIKNINGQVLRGNVRTARMAEPKMEARVLHAPSVSVFPNSAMYSPKTVSRLQSFEESARTPVLQYAHPELGVQAAKYEPPSPPPQVQQQQAQPEDTQMRDGRRQQALAYFGHDIHADRSPFAFEPGLEKESRVKVPKKYTPPSQYYPEKQGKYGPPSYYVNDEASFWTLVKNKMRTSLDKVSDLTRPVVDPLVEATHKITGNLGFGNGNRELTNVVKEKLGIVATPSVLLPALGLVAGGAALGLGAVAVGRLVDRILYIFSIRYSQIIGSTLLP